MSLNSCILCFIFVFISFSYVKAEFRFSSFYQDHMVLQRAPLKARLWGYADENTLVLLVFNGKRYETISERQANTQTPTWTITLDPVQASNTPVNLEITGISKSGVSNTIRLNDVLFGDVWVCGGQSNMDMELSRTFNGPREMKDGSAFSNIRIFKVGRLESDTPAEEFTWFNIPWGRPSNDNLGGMSALCWYFGKELNKKLNVPIGLISSSVGGTRIERWMSSEAFNSCPSPKDQQITLYNGMIYPLHKSTIYGVIWNQGEQNTFFNLNNYKCNFLALISDWRKKWANETGGLTNPNFPFGFVQIGNANANPDFVDMNIPLLRFYQTAGYGYAPNPEMNNVFMTSVIDLVDNYEDPIHSRYKLECAQRLALGALNLGYRQNVEYSAPRVTNVTSSSRLITVNFASEFLPIQFKLVADRGFEVCCQSDPQDCSKSQVPWQPLYGITLFSTYATLSKPVNCAKPHYIRYLWKAKPCEFKACPLYAARSQLPLLQFLNKVYNI